VNETRKILIITDETHQIRNFAEEILYSFRDISLKNYCTSVLEANNFSGEFLLPSYAFFIGCTKPKPLSFSYLEDLLGHINLAGRPCGIFSSNRQTIKYLSGIIHPSEAEMGNPFIFTDKPAGKKEVLSWIKSILIQGEKNV